MIPERFRPAHDAGMRRLQAGGEGRVLGKRLEMHALRADGSEFPMEMVLWRTAAGGAVFYTASIADVSERHDAERQIERQREALRQSEKLTAMGSLLAGVAHELNNPLAIVMGRASLLEEKCEEPPRAEGRRRAHPRSGRALRPDRPHLPRHGAQPAVAAQPGVAQRDGPGRRPRCCCTATRPTTSSSSCRSPTACRRCRPMPTRSARW